MTASAHALKSQIEAAFANRIPCALSPSTKIFRDASTGVSEIDDLLEGGLPVGSLTEMVGTECSGRTTLALSFLAQQTKSKRVCAWVDVSDTLSPESAAASGIDLDRLLWVRCGVQSLNKPASFSRQSLTSPMYRRAPTRSAKPWARIEQALRTTDLLLQGGGFSAIVIDFGSVAPQRVLRIPLSTWFRYRSAAERSQTSVLLLTQHACSKSSAGLVMHLRQHTNATQESTVLTNVERHVEISRHRFAELPAKVVSLRKPPQKANATTWHSRTAWASIR